MATYKYRQLGVNGSGQPSASIAYVDYNITPDYGTPVFPGDTITIEGQAYCRDYKAALSFNYYSAKASSGGGVAGSFRELFAWRVSKGKAGKFALTFTLDGEAFDGSNGPDDRTGAACMDCQFALHVASGDWLTGEVMWLTAKDSGVQRLLYARYPLSPRILEMDFERAAPSGGGYAFADDGQYLLCRALRIGKNAKAAAGDFNVARVVCAGSDGSVRTANLTGAQLAAALTANGYTETAPGVFAGFASALGVTYTLTLTLGDEFEQISFVDTVMRSFARLHLSGASTGGVAVGKFSAATEGRPLFEVAEDHESIFYGGIRGVTNYAAGEAATGGRWIDGKPVYRAVFTQSGMSGGSTAVIGALEGTPDTVLSVEAVAHGTTSNGSIFRPFGFITAGASNGGDSSVSIGRENRTVEVRIGANWGSNTVVVIIEYTRA